jgi:8-oxo-dGTP diphosphatase
MSLINSEPNINTSKVDISKYFGFALSVDCVIFGYDKQALKVLLIKSDLPQFRDELSLLGDLVKTDEDIDAASYRVLYNRTGLKDVYLEQVKTFSELGRHPAGRVLTVAFYALVNIKDHQLKFVNNDLHWHDVKDIKHLAFDHKIIFDSCLDRLKKKIQEEPIIFNLLENKFSLRDLQNLYETILDVSLDRRNFRKKLFATGFLTDINQMEQNVPHRPGKLYTFNHIQYAEVKKKTFVGINF